MQLFYLQQHTVSSSRQRRVQTGFAWIGCVSLWLLGLISCREEQAWPHLPARDAAQITSLLSRYQRRFRKEKPVVRSLDRAFVWSWLDKTPLSQWQVGWPSIKGWLQRQLAPAQAPRGHRWLLWGTFHDADQQIDAFRRLLFHDGVGGWSLIGLEALRADGRWRGVPTSQQRGDDGLLGRLMSKPGGGWEVLHRRQKAHNYTGWKYGYLSSISSLISVAKGRQVPVSGCDMNGYLQQRFAHIKGGTTTSSLRPSLRELHCYLALRRRLRLQRQRRGQIGVVWGMAHAMPGGFWRWLPQRDKVVSVYVMGYRPNPLSPEGQLGKSLVLLDPLLLPLPASGQRGREALLLLPDQHMGGRWSRARTSLKGPVVPDRTSDSFPSTSKAALARRGLLMVTSTEAGHLSIASLRISLPSEKTKAVVVPAGCWAFSWRSERKAMSMIGRLCIPAGGKSELLLEPERRHGRKVLWQRRGL